MSGGDRDDPALMGTVGPEGLDATMEAGAIAAPARDAESGPFPRGAVVDHFVVLGQLGAGAMGVVVAAYDPDLDRKVAIKILKPGVWAGATETMGRQRLLREAQAMAKLSHPNVVSVYECGTLDDELFVAMEFIDGTTLGGWLHERDRSWREIRDTFASAGEGLSAAHRAGLVHRDFKPDNVLVSHDGAIRVTDFGLVGSTTDDGATPAGDDVPDGARSTLDVALTATGAIMGTPVYMAPEQHRCEPTDARTDQFAFCVALYEALYGQRPFAGDNYVEIMDSVLTTEPRSPPSGTDVPGWLRDIVRRGLSVDPAQRYPDMQALLADLKRDPAVRRRRWFAALGIAALAAVAVVGFLRKPAGGQPLCQAADEHVAAVWNDGVRGSIRQSFDATKTPYAADSHRAVIGIIDAYTTGWIEMRTEACEATHVRGEQSETLMDARMACLDDRLRAVEELSTVFSNADAGAVERSVAAAAALPSLQRCGDARALNRILAPPSDPGEAAKIVAVQSELSRAKVLRDTGDYGRAVEVAQQAVATADSLGYAPLRAAAHYRLADARDWAGDAGGAEESALVAIESALAGRDDELLVQSATLLVWVVGVAQVRMEEGHRWAQWADAALGDSGDPVLRARLFCNRGTIYQNAGSYDDAVAALTRCIELRKASLSPGHIDIAKAHTNLGNTYYLRSDNDHAIDHHEQAIEGFRASVGARHPLYANALNSLGATLLDRFSLHEDAEALERGASLLAEALAIRRATLGDTHAIVAQGVHNLANARQYQKRYKEALDLFDQALAIWAERGELENNTQVANIHHSRGITLSYMGDHEQAVAAITRALVMWEALYGPDHIDVARAESALAQELGEAGRHREAAVKYERALAIRIKAGVAPRLIATNKIRLAMQLWESGRQRSRALALAKEAVAEHPIESDADKAWLAGARAWIAGRK